MMSNITTHLASGSTCVALGWFKILTPSHTGLLYPAKSLIDIRGTSLGMWNPGNLYRKYNKFIGNWEWDRQSVKLSLKTLIRPHSLQEWKLRFSNLLQHPGWDAAIYAKPNCETRCLWWWAIHCWSGDSWQIPRMCMGCAKDLRQRRSLESQKIIPFGCKVSRIVTQKQRWYDFIAVGTTPEEKDWLRDRQTNIILVSLWKSLKLEQQFGPASCAPSIPDARSAPAETSGI